MFLQLSILDQNDDQQETFSWRHLKHMRWEHSFASKARRWRSCLDQGSWFSRWYETRHEKCVSHAPPPQRWTSFLLPSAQMALSARLWTLDSIWIIFEGDCEGDRSSFDETYKLQDTAVLMVVSMMRESNVNKHYFHQKEFPHHLVHMNTTYQVVYTKVLQWIRYFCQRPVPKSRQWISL